MARTKKLNLVLHYSETPYHINDLGEGKTPRFELYNTETKTVVAKSNNPLDFHEKIDLMECKNENVKKPTKKKTKRT